MNPDTQFSKERIEMLCDGVFAIAMTLLVLELKVPDLPKPVTSGTIWHALGEHRLGFFAYFLFVLALLLAAQWWLARRSGLLRGGDDVKRRRFATMMGAFPVLFGLLFVAALFDPESAGLATIPGVLAILAIRKLAERRAHAELAS